jgi:hypothetical protein
MLFVVGLAFFLSGAAALAYQVAWQRLLALQTGVGRCSRPASWPSPPSAP